MNISTRCEYACRAVLELALHEQAGEPLTAEVIAERRHIPEKFLVHILLQLKRVGIVRSVRGAKGGYVLAKTPEDVTLLDIVRAIDGPVLFPLPLKDEHSRDMAETWKAIALTMEENLRAATVRVILDKADKSDMFYI